MENIKWVGSPNYSDTRFGATIDRIVCHWIVGTLEAADATFKNPQSQVSAHYGVGDKDVHQYVYEDDTAWHTGVWTMNNRSLGIEHEGGPNLPISDETYQTSSQLIRELCEKYSIPIDRTHIIKHSEVKNTTCPGTLDLDKLISMAKNEEIPEDCDECVKALKECESEKFRYKKERNECRISREKELYEHNKTIKEKDDQIESLQKSNAESTAQLALLNESYRNLQKSLEDVREAHKALEDAFKDMDTEKTQRIEILTEANQNLSDSNVLRSKENRKLKDKLDKGLDGYSTWELFKAIWR